MRTLGTVGDDDDDDVAGNDDRHVCGNGDSMLRFIMAIMLLGHVYVHS